MSEICSRMKVVRLGLSQRVLEWLGEVFGSQLSVLHVAGLPQSPWLHNPSSQFLQQPKAHPTLQALGISSIFCYSLCLPHPF